MKPPKIPVESPPFLDDLTTIDAYKQEFPGSLRDLKTPKETLNTTNTISPGVLQEIIERVREILPAQPNVSPKVSSHVLTDLLSEKNEIEDIPGEKSDKKAPPLSPSSTIDYTTSTSDIRSMCKLKTAVSERESSAVLTHFRPTPKLR